ncbi:hypothetical protein Tco_0282108 [Tanacetum coccineum]
MYNKSQGNFYSSVIMALPLPTTSGSLGVVSDTGSLIVTPPTGAQPCVRKAGSKLSLIARSMVQHSTLLLPFLDHIQTHLLSHRDQDHTFFLRNDILCFLCRAVAAGWFGLEPLPDT